MVLRTGLDGSWLTEGRTVGRYIAAQARGSSPLYFGVAWFAIATREQTTRANGWPLFPGHCIPGTIGHCTLNPDNALRAWTFARQKVLVGKWNIYRICPAEAFRHPETDTIPTHICPVNIHCGHPGGSRHLLRAAWLIDDLAFHGIIRRCPDTLVQQGNILSR